MNKQRRIRLGSLLDVLEKAVEELEAITTEERESFENLPTGLQESEKGCAIDANASLLEDCLSMLQDDIVFRLNGDIE